MSISAPTPLLLALESLDLPASIPAAARPRPGGPETLAWTLSRSRTGLEVDVFACIQGLRHWRQGTRLAARDWPEPGHPGWAGLGATEQAALQALRGWHRQSGPMPPLALLAALEGHGRVSWAPGLGLAGSRVALVRELAALVVTRAADGWRLALSVRPEPGPIRLRLQGDRLLFTGFGPLHRRLDALLGAGQTVPLDQAPRLAAILGRLLVHLPLLTDLPPQPAPPEQPGGRKLLVWTRGGGERLDWRLRVQPGPGLPWMLPGDGPEWAVAGPAQARSLWRRDLHFERSRAAQLTAQIPAAAQALADPLAWHLEGRTAVAEYLAELATLGNRVGLDGVPGFTAQLPEPVRADHLALTTVVSAGGLTVSGSLAGQALTDLLPTLASGTRFLHLDSGHILDLSGQLGLGLRQMAAWGRVEAAAVRLPALTGPLCHSLGLGLDRAEALEPAPVPAGFQGSLRPYQVAGFQWLARLLDAGIGACLADDMGLGKTVQTAALLAHRAATGPALVVAPTSVAGNWQAELARFCPGLQVWPLTAANRAERLAQAGPGQVLLASYGTLLSAADRLQAVTWATVVLDEAHAIKNPDTQRAQISRQLRCQARLALTGTPVENHPRELAALMGWLLPEWADRFVQADLAQLRLLAAPFLLRRLKAEVLPELPPRIELTVWVPLDPEEARFHQDLLSQCRAQALAGGVVSILAALMKLRRACGHPALVDPDYRGPGAKLDLLLDRLGTLRETGQHSLVFSQFTSLLDRVQTRLDQAGISWVRLDGTMTGLARQRAVAAFQAGQAEVFLLSLRAGGTGLNLTQADTVFHLDPWWNPAVEDQASDRAHRLGQTRPVTIHRLLVPDSVEARVLALHEHKRALVGELLEGRGQIAELDRQTLEALLG